MVAAAGIEPAWEHPTRVQVWRVCLSATLQLSSYGRCPPREGDHESPSHWPNPRARPSRRLADSRRLGQQVKAAASDSLLSGFQAEDGKPRKHLGLNAFQAAACCACFDWYFPGSGLSIRFSITNRTSVDRNEVILSDGNCSAVAIFAAVNASELYVSKYRITRSVSGPTANAFAARGLPELWFGDDYKWHSRPFGYANISTHRVLALALAAAVNAMPQETLSHE